MKRFLSVILIISVCISLFVIHAFADMGAPEFLEYEATVTNENGAVDTFSGNTIPYGSTVTVQGEYDSSVSVSYNGNYYSIPASDVKPVESSIGPENGIKLNPEEHYWVIAFNGLEVKSGPSSAYDTVGVIPNGEEFVAVYGNTPSEHEWVYTEYNGASGWVKTGTYTPEDVAKLVTGYDPYTGNLVALKNSISIQKSLFGDDFASTTVPAGAEVSFKYYLRYVRDLYAYIEYNNEQGWVNVDSDLCSDFAVGVNDILVCMESTGLEMYSGPFNSGENLGKVLPYNTPVSADLYAREYISKVDGHAATYDDEYPEYSEDFAEIYTYRITLDGVEGWVTTSTEKYAQDSVICGATSYLENVYSAKIQMTVTSEPFGAGNTVCTLDVGDQFVALGSVYDNSGSWDMWSSSTLVMAGDVIGWVEYVYSDVTEVGKYYNPGAVLEDDLAVLDTEIEITEYKDKDTGNPSGDPLVKLIITCVASAIAVAVCAASALILLKKKKQK